MHPIAVLYDRSSGFQQFCLESFRKFKDLDRENLELAYATKVNLPSEKVGERMTVGRLHFIAVDSSS